MKLLRNFFLDVHNQLMSLMDTDDENIQNLNKQQDLVKYYEDAVKFLEVLAKSMVPMRDLLDSVNISEMQEAVDFFIVTFKFSIDNALEGILGNAPLLM